MTIQALKGATCRNSHAYRSSSLTKALDAILRLLVSFHTHLGKANFQMCRDIKRVKMSSSSI